MTDKVWELAKNTTLAREGDFQNDKDDRGNWTSGKIGVGELKGTKYGICAMSYPDIDIENLTLDEALKLYYRDYWAKCKCDKLPDCLSVAVFDYAFNSGITKAIKDLQKVLGVVVDGKIGNQTIGASYSKPLKVTLFRYFEERMNFLTGLANFKKYGKGWTARVNNIKKICEGLCE